MSEKRLSRGIAVSLFVLVLILYLARMAPSVVPGDPGEYQLVAARWGIGHPPGYGFYALLGNLFTHLVPIGTFAWRANLLAATCGAAIVALAYGIGRTLSRWSGHSGTSLRRQVPSILGALTLAAGLDLWQHAIHANAHVVTALLATVSMFCLARWEQEADDRWLYLFCLVAGVSPAQHPLLVFAFPAYAAFVLAVRPSILRDGRTILKMIGCALLGASAFLYYPLRCAIGTPPPPGPGNMHTWDGFIGVVTARGLRVNLGGFSPFEIARRLWDVRVPLGLQYTPLALCLAGVGFAALWIRRWRPALLLSGYVFCIVLVTVNVLQDAMAYLLGPVVVIGVLIGVGVDVLISVVRWGGSRRVRRGSPHRPGDRAEQGWVTAGLLSLLALFPLWSAAVNWTRMDLSGYRDADVWLERIEARFVGQRQRAALLTEWERMTTIYYYAAVQGRAWDEEDVRFVPIWAGEETPFLDAVDANLPLGPVYLTTYRPEVATQYRLLPSGDLWQVLPAWPRDLPAEARPAGVAAVPRQAQDRLQGQLEIVGWRLDRERAHPGEVLLLDLYMRLPDRTGQYYLPWARLGETTYAFTTDSRFLTPWWQPGEIVVERFELPVPWKADAGQYPLQVGVRLVDEGRDLELASGGTLTTLTQVTIDPARWRPSDRRLDGALGNLRGEILLRGTRVDGRRVTSGEQRLSLRPGRTLRVVLEWESLRPIESNYKVFVQLLSPGLQIVAQGDDKAPLRGSAPTWLWFPRWRRGTRITDSYLLDVPPDLPPGQYPLVVGMYGFSTFQRVQVVSPEGDMEGDWVTLAHLEVE